MKDSSEAQLFGAWAPAVSVASGDFVGRTRELALLRSGLQAAIDGRGQIAMVAGEAGIGKTRLLEELATEARRTGAVVLWGRCEEVEAGGGYAPFREALDGYVRDADDSELGTVLGARRAVLGQLVPRLRERFPDLPQPVALDPDDERARLFDAVSQCLIALSRQTPLVLVLDDLKQRAIAVRTAFVICPPRFSPRLSLDRWRRRRARMPHAAARSQHTYGQANF
jgi:hypothetical protein